VDGGDRGTNQKRVVRRRRRSGSHRNRGRWSRRQSS
jgi:hypothetical protein